jgi:hypothetical protein
VALDEGTWLAGLRRAHSRDYPPDKLSDEDARAIYARLRSLQ